MVTRCLLITILQYVAVLDINEISGNSLINEITINYGRNRADFFKCDVTKTEQLHGIFEKVKKEHDVIDVIVNNAGIATEKLQNINKVIEINFTATVSSTRKALEMMRVDHGGNGGTVINISSISALTLGSPNLFTYSATKSAILYFSNCIGKEEYYKHTNVRVLTVCFGVTDTAIWNQIETADDDIVQKKIEQVLAPYSERNSMQTAEVAAQGLVQSYNKGASGSTWFVNRNKTTDITEYIHDGYKIISSCVKF